MTPFRTFATSLITVVSINLLLLSPATALSPEDQTDLEMKATVMSSNYDRAHPNVLSAWPGFDPSTIPKIVVIRNNQREVQALVTVDHPHAEELGDVIDIPSKTSTIKFIPFPKENAAFVELENFDFNKRIAGANAFIIASDCTNFEFPLDCLDHPDFMAYFLHEVFHRYQEDHFAQPDDYPDQEVYNYTADFIHATLIESRLLAAAAREEDATILNEIAQEIVGVRNFRMGITILVRLDESQERYEGTARFVEDRTGLTNPSLAIEFLRRSLSEGEVKSELGFGRFYLTGAQLIELSIRLGSKKVTQRIQDGETPMEVLTSLVSPIAPEKALAAGKKRVDPDNLLEAEAEKYSRWAKLEPNIFDDL